MTSIIPVILCGGSGSRLWPASRESFPKQFLPLAGDLSLFRQTLARVAGPAFAPPIVVTSADYRFLVAEQMRASEVTGDLVLEPARRDSAAAVAAACEVAIRRDADALVLILAADHAIPDTSAFLAHVERGIEAALAGYIVTFGIRPTAPATGYGYIAPGVPLVPDGLVRAIEGFVEKPDRAVAERYLAAGFLWNSGNFLFKASVFLDELHTLEPGIAEPVRASVAHAVRDLDFIRLDPDDFTRSIAKSVDYAVMERTSRAAVVPSDFAWSDIGSWAAIWQIAEKDRSGNAASGDAVFQNASGCYVSSPDILTAVVGVSNVVVVTTKDAVLVAAKDRTEEVKAVVSGLIAAKRKEATSHRLVYRPWGHYDSVDMGRRYQVKRITVNPGSKLSLQSHFHRSEHWVVVSGTALVTVDETVTRLTENDSIYIPLGAVHRLENPGRIPLEIIEVQSGSYLGEDDIVRYEDVYNRA